MSEQPKDLFLQACGLTGPLELLVTRPGGTGGRRRGFEQPVLLVGRDAHNDLCLEDEQVSRRHAYFQVVAGWLFGLDLSRRTGTHWANGPRPSGWIAPGE